jgi:inner membrane protein
METIEKIRNSLFNSVGLKLALIAFLCLMLLIPSMMITGLIREREQRRDETIKEVTSIWGNAQTLTGPVLTVPVKSTVKSGSDLAASTLHYAHYLPEELKITGTVEPEVRYRGIYHVVTYHAKLHVSGTFVQPDLSSLAISPADVAESRAWVEIGIPDMRGIKQNIRLHWGDSVSSVIPGIPSQQISQSGIHIPVIMDYNKPVPFSFDLDMNGSYSLNFIPLGKETRVDLSSSWNAPKFNGAFFPDDRKINDAGFTANWNILQLNRNYPQQWLDNQYSVAESSFGFDLITPVDTYQKSMRSVKYAILFIALTFLVFFFAEIMTAVRIHPINYLLVGIALCIFYSLLTALSEYIPFGLAYFVASITIVGMIAVFAHSLYKKMKVTSAISATLATLYIYLYVILQLSDYSLLFGNIGLVLILGIVMYFSRKIDWYSPVKEIKSAD